MNRDLAVYVDVDASPVRCGRLWTRSLPRQGASFEYDPTWLARPGAFALEPELPLGPGQLHTARPVFRAFSDPAPDRWGQTLLRRVERARAAQEGRAPRTLASVDFLTLVDDETRLGALRFRDFVAPKEAPFLTSDGRPVPPLLDLPRLMSAARRIVAERETDEDLALLLAPGTSLGGARPKASVRDSSGGLLFAKFSRKDDEWPVIRWEAVSLSLAQSAGIEVPRHRLEVLDGKPLLLLERFDRAGRRRIPFQSAMTALSADDGALRSYLEIVDALRRTGSDPGPDLVQLWRRMVFNVLISNTDDHLRNHGLLHDGRGWRLAPAYDMNPMATDVRPRIHALALDSVDPTASMDTVLRMAPRFGLAASDAQAIAREIATAVSTWRQVGTRLGLRPRDLDRMASAFEHDDRIIALR